MSTAHKRSAKNFDPTEPLRAAFSEALVQAPSPEAALQDWLQLLATTTDAVAARLHLLSAGEELTVAATTGTFAAKGETPATDDAPQQERTLRELLFSDRPRIISQRKLACADDKAERTSGYVPLAIDKQHCGVIELLFKDASSLDERQRAVQIAQIAALCWETHEIQKRRREEDARRHLIDEVEQFVRRVHEKLEMRYTAYTTANDGRQIIKCDRASVLLARGGRFVLTAVSGVDEVEKRSQASKLLCQLVRVTAATGETMHYDGVVDGLAPQCRNALNDYLDETAIRAVTIVPLIKPAPPSADVRAKSRIRPLGALVIEQIEDIATKSGRNERIAFVAEHATLALAKSLEHESIPFLPLWRLTARVTQRFAPGRRLRTYSFLTVLTAAVAALCFVPADFTVHARGELKPTLRRHVFAPLDGTVSQIHVRHGDRVVAGQVLMELRNTDLDVSLADVAGQRTATSEQLLATERSLFEADSEITLQERHRLAGRRSELKQQLVSQDEQLRLLRHKQTLLRVTSPIDGEITTWDVEHLLRNRPVREGQVLIDVADATGPWELELQVPEDGIAQLLSARSQSNSALAIHYRLAAEPRTDRTAHLNEVHYSAEIREQEGNTVLAKATLDDDPLPVLVPGAEASAKVYCGRRALGYVWLHDAIDFLRMKVWFRLY